MDQIAGAEEPDIGLSLPSVCVWSVDRAHTIRHSRLICIRFVCFCLSFCRVHSLLASSMCGLNTCHSFVFVQVISGSFVCTYEIFRWF